MVADLTGLLKLTTSPAGMRVLVRAERPHSGPQLRFTDVAGNRLTAFARHHHRRAARGPGVAPPAAGPLEDRIRNAKDTGMRIELSHYNDIVLT